MPKIVNAGERKVTIASGDHLNAFFDGL